MPYSVDAFQNYENVFFCKIPLKVCESTETDVGDDLTNVSNYDTIQHVAFKHEAI